MNKESINDNFNVKDNGCTGNCQTCTSVFCTKAPNVNDLHDVNGKPLGIDLRIKTTDEHAMILKRSIIKK